MKKFVAAMMLVVVLAGMFCAHAEYSDEIACFVDGFDFEIFEAQDGSGTMYVTCNDHMGHGVMIYVESIESDTATMTIYRNHWEDQVGETKTVSIDDYEYAVEDVVMKLYKIETAYEDYEAGEISKECLDDIVNEYRTTLW